MLDERGCQELRDHFETCAYDYPVIPTLGISRRIAPPPDNFAKDAGRLMYGMAHHFGLPFRTGTSSLVEYLPGHSFPPHTDAGERLAKSLGRTVSFTILLSHPEEFEGGALRVRDEDMEMEQGDCVGFTARTMHEVTEITSGRRLVWIAFGEA